MRNIKHWKYLLSFLFGLAVFVACMWPLRPLLNYHEQLHLFRWTTTYLREQSSTSGGWVELGVSFITQLFYWGWLGSLIMAILLVALQGLCSWLLRLVRLGHPRFYPLSFIPSVLLLCFVFVPTRYRSEASFRQSVLYDHLVRHGKWDALVRHAKAETILSDHALRCVNYALAIQGRLTDDLFTLEQRGTDALILDTRHTELLPLFSLSDIFFRLGLVNDAERLAFEAKQYLPANSKSGRLYRRLAEVNLINGDSAIAAKYLHVLQSTLFYHEWSNRLNAVLRGEQQFDSIHYYFERQRYRLKQADQLSPNLRLRLEALMLECPDNHLAGDYCEAYDLLRANYDCVLADELWIQQQRSRVPPRAVQECIVGNWVVNHPNDSFPIPVSKKVMEETIYFLRVAEQNRDMLCPTLCQPPYSQSYWHYYGQFLQRIQER